MFDDNPAAATMRKDKAAATVGYVGCSEDGNDVQYWVIKIERSGCNDDDGIDDRRR